MSDFKLIAIKTGKKEKCTVKFKEDQNETQVDYLKNLMPNKIYTFYNQYSFPQNDFAKIQYHPDRDIDLYSIDLSNNRKISVNICAVVGKNGSGKSSLTELIYWANYNLGCLFKLLEDKDGNRYSLLQSLELELLYSSEKNHLHLLRFENGKVLQKSIYLKTSKKGIINKRTKWEAVSNITILKDFFYSLVINYSHYSLNALELGDWINPLFHKNDGYQTPIVLNPKRDNGNIEINNEKRLLSRRLQANVLEVVNGDLRNSLRNLGNDKIATEFVVRYNSNYFNDRYEKYHDFFTDRDTTIVTNCIKKYFKLDVKALIREKKDDEKYIEFAKRIVEYVYYKLVRMVFNYSMFIKYRNGKSIKNVENLFNEIKQSDSHIFFKIKGAILHLRYFTEIYQNRINFNAPFSLEIEKISSLIEDKKRIEKTVRNLNTYMMAMPSFFDVQIIPAELSMDTLSSGEKQHVFSMSSIVYHLVNLNSVDKNKYRRYDYINILLDEIELYYHPGWQRTYVDDLLGYISRVNPENLKNIKGINITFVTHSPFILSDVPNQNILRLEDGEPQPFVESEKTFGANIHDLLANDFFMSDCFIGQYAYAKIQKAFDLLHSEKQLDPMEKDALKSTIQIIGEPFLREELLNLYYSNFPREYSKAKEIAILEERLKALRDDRNS